MGETLGLVRLRLARKLRPLLCSNVQTVHYRTLVFHRGCQDAIDNFLIEEKSRIREEEARKKKLEEDGEYEVSRIMDVQILDGGKEFFFLFH